MSVQELASEKLIHTCDPASLGFVTTDELPDLTNVIGQPRALRALELGSEVAVLGYNIFVLGIPGSGRTTLTQEYLQRKAIHEPVPGDLCYVYNFGNPLAPRALILPAGRGASLRKELQELVDHFKVEMPRLIESEEYNKHRESLMGQMKEKQESEFQRLQENVQKHNFVLARTAYGFVLAPAVNGEPLKPEEIEKLTLEQREKLEKLQASLGEEVQKTMLKMRDVEREASEQVRELNHRSALYLLTPMIEGLKTKYADLEQVLAHLEVVQKDILDNINQFIPAGQDSKSVEGITSRSDWLRRYTVNLLVDNSNQQGAPVIVESQPTHQNLIGRIEHEFFMGASRTDFTMMRAGAFHRATGGYLILPSRDVLVNPYAWEGLKRVLRDRNIRIVELSNQLGVFSTATLEPEAVPLQTKVILVGTPMLYYLLRAHDEDFAKLFKVRAEFATVMERNPDTEREYGLYVKSVVDDNHLPPFDNTAVAKTIEFSSRLADDQQKLSTRFGKIADLICEAAYWAKKDGQSIVTSQSVQAAIDNLIYRHNLLDEQIQETIFQDTLKIDVNGARIGQVNGLSVMSMGDYEFGRPTRLTASAIPGRNGVLDIERQANLGGSIHTKGMLILNGLLQQCYGRKKPINLTASITFEQSYDKVEGDSASAAELYVLLSAVTEIPIRQDRAVTGSINQLGEIQAIGGINEKIEGFFSVCNARGLNGEQGVIIPKSNIRHLMLNQEVRQAVEAGKFHIWPISTLDEGFELLTGKPAGKLKKDGGFPAGSFNHAVMTKLAEFTKALEPLEPKKKRKKKSTRKPKETKG